MLPAILLLFAATSAAAELEIRVVYDNTSAGLAEDWGFAALVTFQGRNVLFDSGTKPDLFLRNFDALKLDAKAIRHAVISHEHGDHRNGIYKLYPRNPAMRVHFLDNFPAPAFDEATAVALQPARVRAPAEIVPGVFTTGIIEGNPPEQSLLIETSKGLVILTGCSHPGILKIVETAKRQRGAKSIRMLIGGFHMFRMPAGEIDAIVTGLRNLGVESIVPAHCTGDPAKQRFREVFGQNCSEAGAGKLIRLD